MIILLELKENILKLKGRRFLSLREQELGLSMFQEIEREGREEDLEEEECMEIEGLEREEAGTIGEKVEILEIKAETEIDSQDIADMIETGLEGFSFRLVLSRNIKNFHSWIFSTRTFY